MGRRASTLKGAIVVVLWLGAALPPAAPGQAVETLRITSAAPADGALVAPIAVGGIPWQIAVAGPPPGADVSVTVSTSPATQPDGTLSTDNRVDFFFLTEGAPGSYSGRSDPGPNPWSDTFGTYYWQAIATWTDGASVLHSAASRVQRVNIGTPPPAPPAAPPGASSSADPRRLAMSPVEAATYVRALIRRRTRREPRVLRYRCARVSSRSFRCRPRWRDSRNVYAATATVTHARVAPRIVARVSLGGLRATRRCTRSRTMTSCGRRFRWRAVMPARQVDVVR